MIPSMLKIRLARVGKRGHATFRIVATEHTRPPKSGSLAQLGSYDPHANAVRVNAEKLKTYLKHGAKISPTVHNLLIEHKVLEGKKVRAWKPKRKPEPEGQKPEQPAATSEVPPLTSEVGKAAAEKPAEKKNDEKDTSTEGAKTAP